MTSNTGFSSLVSNGQVYTDLQGLAALCSQVRGGDDQAIEAVAAQFEAIFLHMLVKGLRQTLPGDSMLSSNSLDMYTDLFDHQLSLSLSSAGGVGLREILMRQLGAIGESREFVQLPESAPASPGAAQTHVPPARRGADFRTPAEFVTTLRPYAERAGAELGVDPSVLLAQAALETGWGKHMVRHGDGRSTNNFFGLKADSRWQGERANISTLEQMDGVMTRVRADFRSYPEIPAAFADYASFISGSPRYQQAMEAVSDPSAYLNALQNAGYATDPHYASKILAVLEHQAFTGQTGSGAPDVAKRQVAS